MFEFVEAETTTLIKVIGVGGAGGNAVEHMIREGVQGVEFICANTDAQALSHMSAGVKLQLGPGLGAGGKPDVGREHALASREQIADALRGAHMVFITAGMGGGTGTGAAPIVAQVARELDILTVAVVTKPFDYEGKRMSLADAGLKELEESVDSLIVVLNERLMEVLGEDVLMDEAFRAADNVLKNAVGGIAEVINVHGHINVDFQDVRTVMGEMGKAMMGSGEATGVDRARIAAENAAASPLLEGIELSGARGVLVNVSASKQLSMKEYKEVMATIRQYTSPEATVICGLAYDEGMEDRVRVTVVATGLGAPNARKQAKPTLAYAEIQRTGTDNVPLTSEMPAAAGVEFGSVFSSSRAGRAASVESMEASGVAKYDIPAFLRKQAD
jgi:cell division protein FtsZ